MRLITTIVNWVAGLQDQGPRIALPTTPERLRELRSVGHTILDDVRGEIARVLAERIDAANHANDFWHMRPRLFDAVSTEFGEVVAGRRLLQLDMMLQVNHDRRSQFARATEPSTGPGGLERRGVRHLAAPAPTVKRRRSSNRSPFRTTTQSAT
ncbi:MAG: hypothetical protein WA210_09500 [Burkholderiaceae bacterium]